MRSAQEVESRIRFLLVKELEVRVMAAATRLPHSCVHNYRHPLDVRKTVGGEANENYNRVTRRNGLPMVQTIGLCLLLGPDGTPASSPGPESWGGTICEDPVDAQRCRYFTPTVTKENLVSEFSKQLKDPEWVKENLPEVYGLLWSLDGSLPGIPWWVRLICRFLRIEVEPLKVIEDPGKLLE